MSEDPRQAAARYRLDRDAEARGEAVPKDDAGAPARGSSAAERAAYVETAIQQAIRRGDFDDLPGAGKPLDLGTSSDPDWWIRRKIETEKLTGLGPPALTLRVEHAEMAARLDALSRADDVREAVTDFNRRIIEARRQLLGGPPVVTPTLDVDAEVSAWADRRAERMASTASAPRPAPRGWFRRRVARKRRLSPLDTAEDGESTREDGR
ncbi:J-domain-containing protein [Microbacterium sp. RD1]|uniref:DnaJ family domain-containing protein n=1 Tax=Microbacterium sp. RD1 TaxID=3457313 RepID=UPI003FA5CAB3